MKLAIIPARGGSKRIPRKNIKPFCGKPMIAWSIEAALASGCFDRVIVSTDDAEIAEVSLAHGAEVPFMRPPELSDDHTGTIPVVAHAVGWMGQHVGPVEFACCLYATALNTLFQSPATPSPSNGPFVSEQTNGWKC
jgi:N-acylneuraminate cytidylyltransferase